MQFKEVSKKISIAFVLYLLILSNSFCLKIVKEHSNSFTYMWSTLFLLLLVSVGLFLANWLNIFDVKKARMNLKDIRLCLPWIFYMFLVKVIGGCFLLLEGNNITGNQLRVDNLVKNIPFFIIFLAIGIVGPIMEEILFRGYLIKICFFNNMLLGIIVSSILFGIAHHPTNIASFVIYGGIGGVLGFLYKRYNRLELTIFLHMINNISSLLIM